MDWTEAVTTAIKRSRQTDKGAIAAREGILGLPLSQTGKTAERCYNAAAGYRTSYQRNREKKRHTPLTKGTTGNKNWDAELKAAAPQAA